MSVSKLVRHAVADMFLAFGISTVIVLVVLVGILLTSGFALQWELRRHVAALPADDQALAVWAGAQPGVEQLAVRRTADAVELRYRRAGSQMLRPLDPPWRDLGYETLGGTELTFSASPSAALAGPLLLLALVLSNQIGFLIVGTLRLRRPKPPGEPLPRPFAGALRPAVIGGVVAGVILLVLSLLYDLGFQAFSGRPADPGPWGAIHDLSPAAQGLTIAFAALMGPVCEEVFFRGAIFGSFVSAGRARLGAVISGAAFAAAHLDLSHVVLILVVGLVLAWIYYRTRSLLAPIVAHALNNAVSLGFIIAG
jgi:membrane protease YdiL (CAAX protease family)